MVQAKCLHQFVLLFLNSLIIGTAEEVAAADILARSRASCAGLVRDPRAEPRHRADGDLVHMYRDSSVAPILNQRRALQSVLDVTQGIRAAGFSLSRGWSSLDSVGYPPCLVT